MYRYWLSISIIQNERRLLGVNIYEYKKFDMFQKAYVVSIYITWSRSNIPWYHLLVDAKHNQIIAWYHLLVDAKHNQIIDIVELHEINELYNQRRTFLAWTRVNSNFKLPN